MKSIIYKKKFMFFFSIWFSLWKLFLNLHKNIMSDFNTHSYGLNIWHPPWGRTKKHRHRSTWISRIDLQWRVGTHPCCRSTNHVRVRHGLSPPIGRSRKGDNRIAGHTSNPPTIQRQLFNTDRTATTGQNPKIHHIMSSTPQIDRVLVETLRTPISLRPMEKLCFPPFAGNSDPSEYQHSYLAARIIILLILYFVDLYFPGQLCEHRRIYSAYFLICNRQTFLINRKCLRTNPPTSFSYLTRIRPSSVQTFIQEDQAITHYIAPHRSHEQDRTDTTKEGAVKRLVYLILSDDLMLNSISS